MRPELTKVLSQARRAAAIAKVDGPQELGKRVVRKIQNTGTSKVEEVDIVHSVLTSVLDGPGVMVDVGAHMGTSAAPFLDSGWKVFAFEPDPKNRSELEAWHGGKPSMTIDTRAVSDSSGDTVDFYTSELSTGISGLNAFHDSHQATSTAITTTLTEALEGYGVESVDFLKVDVEGHDLKVLKGHDFNRWKPKAIVIEFDETKTIPMGHDYRVIADYLVANGYGVLISEWFPIEEYGANHQWRGVTKYPADINDKAAWGNLVAATDPHLLGRIEQAFVPFQ